MHTFTRLRRDAATLVSINEKFMLRIISILTLLLVQTHAVLRADDHFELLGRFAFPGDMVDRSGPKEELQKSGPDRFLGGFSSMEYIGDDQYLVLPDRGPGGSDPAYQCRFHTVVIKVDPTSSTKVSGGLLGTTFLTSSSGRPLVGDPSKVSTDAGDESLRFDPEAIRLLGNDSLVISDEYGPHVYRFTRDGEKIGEFAVPESYKVDFPSADVALEATKNTKGRQANAGFEGLAVTPSGEKIVAIIQKPLIQDSEVLSDGVKRDGVNCRMVVFNPDGQPVNEFVYTLEKSGLGVSEMLAVDEHQFLVMERDSKSGLAAKNKQLFLIDIRNATDVSKVESLPTGPVVNSQGGNAIRSVGKRLVLDLLSPESGMDHKSIEEKQECLTFGPTLADGRRTLILGIDNDFNESSPSVFYVYAVSRDVFVELK
jgi:hypothetical protein